MPSPSERAASAFEERFRARPRLLVRAPGRVNLLGAHVDYSEGWVLPAAVDRHVALAAAPLPGRSLELAALDLGEEAVIDLDRLSPPVAGRAGGGATWKDIPAGVAWALERRGVRLPGLRAVYASDVPIGAGMSSSAAVEMAFALAWRSLTGADLSVLDLAGAGRAAENDYLGVGSGIMDQLTSLVARRGHVLYLDCRTLEWEHLALPPGVSLLLADSGVRRHLAGSGFTSRRQECQRACALLAPGLPGLRTLRDFPLEALDGLVAELPAPLDRRVRHAVTECARVRAGAEALRRGDLAALGRLLRESHASSRDLYEVSVPELDVLAEAAWKAPGCHGARLSGGGFGGCVLALVEEDARASVGVAMETAFEARFGRRPAVFVCTTADGALSAEG